MRTAGSPAVLCFPHPGGASLVRRLAAPEAQGAVLKDGGIDPGEVPNDDLSANDTPGALDDSQDAR